MRHQVYIIVFVALLLVEGNVQAQYANSLPSKGMRDTALQMLQEFVTVGGDLKLGFTPANVMQATIDTLRPVTFYYIGGDSLEHTANPKGMAILVHVNKVLYPVMVGGRICGSISFGHGHRDWSIREFQDSAEILAYMNTMAILEPVTIGNKPLMAAYLPAIDQTVILQGDSAHILVTSTSIGHTTKAKRLAQPSLAFLNKPKMPLDEFMQQCRNHIALTSQNRKKIPLKH